MSWYVVQGRAGQESKIIRSFRQHLSCDVLRDAFCFRCERLWRTGGRWKVIEKEMFPGYVFLESLYPEKLLGELGQFRSLLRIMEEPGYLISVYKAEEENLRNLCGENHCLKISYGYREGGVDYITDGPLKEVKGNIMRFEWHRRFAQVELPVARKRTVVWAGVDLSKR